jgi:hypothetical protein
MVLRNFGNPISDSSNRWDYFEEPEERKQNTFLYDWILTKGNCGIVVWRTGESVAEKNATDD